MLAYYPERTALTLFCAPDLADGLFTPRMGSSSKDDETSSVRSSGSFEVVGHCDTASDPDDDPADSAASAACGQDSEQAPAVQAAAAVSNATRNVVAASGNFVLKLDEVGGVAQPTSEFVYCEGVGGWVEYSIAPQGCEQHHAQLLVRYVSADPRPLRVLVDGVVVGEVCELSTGTWDVCDAVWRASAPMPIDWTQAHVLRLETDAFFPHVFEYALVPCEPAHAAAQREHLARLLDAAVDAGKSDIEKATCLVATLNEALFGRMKGLCSLQKEALEALSATLTAMGHKHAAVSRLASRLAECGSSGPVAPAAASPPSPEPAVGARVVHRTITCDGCGMSPLEGTRYKCMNCADYDLCEQCERRGVHEQHVFLKLKQPLQIVHECQWTTDDGRHITSKPDDAIQLAAAAHVSAAVTLEPEPAVPKHATHRSL